MRQQIRKRRDQSLRPGLRFCLLFWLWGLSITNPHTMFGPGILKNTSRYRSISSDSPTFCSGIL